MEVGNFTLVDVFTLSSALLSLAVAWRALSRTKSNELFALRQSVVLKAEQARSEWRKLDRENESLIKRVRSSFTSGLPESEMLLEFLLKQREHFRSCLLDSAALADDVHANVDKFSEKKCRLYLRNIEPALEKLGRNQGVSTQRLEDLLQRMNGAASPFADI